MAGAPGVPAVWCVEGARRHEPVSATIQLQPMGAPAVSVTPTETTGTVPANSATPSPVVSRLHGHNTKSATPSPVVSTCTIIT